MSREPKVRMGMPLLSSNPMWEDFGQRVLLWAPKALVRFTTSEGADGHCETMARSLYHQRVFDWLDEVLKLAATA
jgi:hypothetical protein